MTGRYHLNQMIKVNIINNGTNRNHDRIQWKEPCTTSVIFLPKTHKWNLINSKQGKHIFRTHHKNKCSIIFKVREVREKVRKETKAAHVATEGNVRFWPGSFCYKGHFQDYLGNLHGVWGQDDSQISVLIS